MLKNKFFIISLTIIIAFTVPLLFLTVGYLIGTVKDISQFFVFLAAFLFGIPAAYILFDYIFNIYKLIKMYIEDHENYKNNQ